MNYPKQAILEKCFSVEGRGSNDAQFVDVDGDGRDEVAILDRRLVRIYRCPS